MAYFRKTKKGVRVEVERAGVRASRTFPTKAAAVAWAAQEEQALLAGKRGQFPARTLADAFARYEREVSPTKRGQRAERLRFTAFLREFPHLAGKVLHLIDAADLAQWRDARLAKVSASSVVREAALLRNVWTVAAREWLWTGEPTPWRQIKLPRKAHARTRRTGAGELRMMLRHLGFRTGIAPTTPQQEVAWAWLVAQHTALRAGEVRAMSRATVDLGRRVYRLAAHKTMEVEGTRWVPFTRKAARVLAVLDDAARRARRDGYFIISADSMSVLFGRARDSLLIPDLHFHDSRADALTRLSRRVDVMTLARISGHRDLRQLLAAYYRESAEEIAARLP